MATNTNASVLKAFEILKLFTDNRSEIGAKDVSTELGLNMATAHRFLLTLEEAGALYSHRRGRFSLSFTLEKLGDLATRSNHLGATAQPMIDQAALHLNESIMASRLGAVGPVCIAFSRARRTITVDIRVGTTLPLHASAQGKLWLAHMPERSRRARLANLELPALSSATITSVKDLEAEIAQIQSQGYASNTGENEPDLAATCVPVFGTQGEMVMSLSAFGMLSRFDDKLIGEIITELGAAARKIESALLGAPT